MENNKLSSIVTLATCAIAFIFVTGCDGPTGEIGPQGDMGDSGPTGASGAPCAVVDNGNGTFTMTCPGSTPVTFGEAEEPNAYVNANMVRGGLLYDKYWKVTGGNTPTGEHPLYPTYGAKTGADTWRCKECHGWDYLGKDGRYAGGSHYTGIKGLYPIANSLWKAFMIIKDEHNFDSSELSDVDIWDLVKFYREGLINISSILNEDGTFKGDLSSGQSLYDNGIPGIDGGGTTTNSSCTSCHGADGTNEIVTGFDAFPGFLSNENPQEYLHKVRFGHPGSSPAMPGSEDIVGSLRDVTNLSAYTQTLSPVLWSNTSVSRGGQLYDKYWIVTAGSAPSGDHSLYPANGAKTGADTWRCKECHGWDYIGDEGRYNSGSHYTGIAGLYPAQRTKWQAYVEIKDGHGYGEGELTDADIWDVVAFYDAGMYDINFMLNPDGTFKGNITTGQTLFENGIGGGASCTSCHGTDGLNEVVPGFTAFPGFLSNDNPQEYAHKALYGQPGSSMVITYDYGATIENVSDLSAWSQTLPQN
jgi:mono/diheme cytochrome c family protein